MPALYDEMLICCNDQQLLRNTDDEALGAFLKYVEANKKKITHLVINGDLLDMEQANRFGTSADMAGTMADEIASVKWFLTTLAAWLPDAEKVFIFGNHDARWFNYLRDRHDGIEEWLKTPEDVFEFKALGWKTIPYGAGQYYRWHERIFWHGHRAGVKSDIAKLELWDTGLVPVTTAHINRNMYHEERNAHGELATAFAHGGFSKDNLHFVKKANSGWSQGFGIYFWSQEVGEQPYMVIMRHGHPRFIGPDGRIYDGTGYDLRKEIGLGEVPKIQQSKTIFVNSYETTNH